jgi:membrane protease YdiL (CAAX protease family)
MLNSLSLTTAQAPLVVVSFLLLWLIAWLPLAVPLAWQLQWQPFSPLTLKQKLSLLAALYLIAPFVVWLVLQWQGMSWGDCGLSGKPNFWRLLLAGLVLGIGGIVFTFIVEGWLGWLQWHGDNWQRLWPSALHLLAAALTIGAVEELVFRGFLLTVLQRDYALWLAAALSSGIFALLHLVWGEAGTVPQLPGLWLMGMVLVLARWVAGGNLGLAWGLHSAWLWGLWALEAAGLFSYTGRGSPWLVGWGNQPLAGLAGIACLGGTGAILWILDFRF